MIKSLFLLAVLAFTLVTTSGAIAYTVGYGYTTGVQDAKR